MEDKQKKYLDKVVEFIVRDTRIDYEKGRIYYPLRTSFLLIPSSPYSLYYFSYSPPSSSFSKYCIDVYGLTDQEIEYVWKKFLTIVKEKVENGK